MILIVFLVHLHTCSNILFRFSSALHSFQNLTVALSGLILGSSIIILVGSNDASPTTKASPISKIGSTSVSPDKLSEEASV